jgi:23S rRNA (adenine2503-C2)-methyltransferase
MDTAHSPPVEAAEPAAPERPALVGLSRERLGRLLEPVLDRPFRVRQIYDAIHQRALGDFGDMTDLPKELRAVLAERFRVGIPRVVDRSTSADGTVKYLFELADGATIEAVDIPDGDRRTFCISSQAGCGLACRFCVTGYWGPGRNLSAGEIVGQVLAIRRSADLPPSGYNLVFMGMGEPLMNLDGVRGALDVLTETVSWRRITVSTAGVVPGIDAMAAWERRPNLALSLHAPDDERRSALMPINRSYPLAQLVPSLERYPLERGRKITVEYILIRDFNEAPADADALARLLRSLDVKINLIPINPDPVLGEDMVPPDDERVDVFQARLERRGLVATVRRRRGDDVSAACGQLRAFGREPRGFEPLRRPG